MLVPVVGSQTSVSESDGGEDASQNTTLQGYRMELGPFHAPPPRPPRAAFVAYCERQAPSPLPFAPAPYPPASSSDARHSTTDAAQQAVVSAAPVACTQEGTKQEGVSPAAVAQAEVSQRS